MYSEESLIPISALQHYAFCPRQCGLIHIDQIWEDNVLTAEGRDLHDKAHSGDTDWRNGVGSLRSLRIRSLEYGIVGQTDVIEIRSHPAREGGIVLPGQVGSWSLLPIEYKRGRQKLGNWDNIQLCAQAICLEEMLGAHISVGCFFYGLNRRRYEVTMTPELRNLTVQTILEVHQLFRDNNVPDARFDKNKCPRCSINEQCGVTIINKWNKKKINSYLDEAVVKRSSS